MLQLINNNMKKSSYYIDNKSEKIYNTFEILEKQNYSLSN